MAHEASTVEGDTASPGSFLSLFEFIHTELDNIVRSRERDAEAADIVIGSLE